MDEEVTWSAWHHVRELAVFIHSFCRILFWIGNLVAWITISFALWVQTEGSFLRNEWIPICITIILDRIYATSRSLTDWLAPTANDTGYGRTAVDKSDWLAVNEWLNWNIVEFKNSTCIISTVPLSASSPAQFPSDSSFRY